MKKRHIVAICVILVIATPVAYGIGTGLFKDVYCLILNEKINREFYLIQRKKPSKEHLESSVLRGLKAYDATSRDVKCKFFSNVVAGYKFNNKGF